MQVSARKAVPTWTTISAWLYWGQCPRATDQIFSGLQASSLKLAIINATSIKNKLRKLLKNKPHDHHHVKSCLETCKELYSGSITSLKNSIKAIKAKRYDDANIYISSVVDAPGTCEDGFDGGGIESPVTKENKDFFKLAVIALAITALLE